MMSKTKYSTYSKRQPIESKKSSNNGFFDRLDIIHISLFTDMASKRNFQVYYYMRGHNCVAQSMHALKLFQFIKRECSAEMRVKNYCLWDQFGEFDISSSRYTVG